MDWMRRKKKNSWCRMWSFVWFWFLSLLKCLSQIITYIFFPFSASHPSHTLPFIYSLSHTFESCDGGREPFDSDAKLSAISAIFLNVAISLDSLLDRQQLRADKMRKTDNQAVSVSRISGKWQKRIIATNSIWPLWHRRWDQEKNQVPMARAREWCEHALQEFHFD